MTRLVEQDGPRTIHHQPLHGFIASCHDCRWVVTTPTKPEAQDAIDTHYCERTTT